jgi:Cell wall-associated hydrolases (invasion-associated proteins)
MSCLVSALSIVVLFADVASAAAPAPSGAPGPRPVLSRADRRLLVTTTVRFSDLGPFSWARTAVRYVAAAHHYMPAGTKNPDGTYAFHPTAPESRIRFARAVVLAFAPADPIDPSITFNDIASSGPAYACANVMVQHGWMRADRSGDFTPSSPVRTIDVHRALALALGLGPSANALNHLHGEGGHGYATPPGFGTLLLGMRLGLRFNNWADESQDVGPTTPLNRAQVAYSLYHALTVPPDYVKQLAGEYGTVVLPKMSGRVRAIVQWGIRFVGYPYVWGGEWGKTSPEPRTLGGQPIPGFDCSGFAWWVLKKNDPALGWEVAPPRSYAGWSLAQRTTYDMAVYAHLGWWGLRPGDLALYREDGGIGHVDIYLGNGWALDSSSTPAGVTIMWIGTGWYRNHFVRGRRVI